MRSGSIEPVATKGIISPTMERELIGKLKAKTS